MIQLTNYAAAANVREAVDGLASAALIEADVDALAAFLVIMIFLSASPPIFTPAPLDGDAIDEVEGVAKVAVGGIWEEESEGRNVFIGLKKWCCHDHFVKGLLSWGGGDGGKGAVGGSKRNGEIVLRAMRILVDSDAWPAGLGNGSTVRWHEERALRLHLNVVKDSTLANSMRAALRDFSSLARARLSEMSAQSQSLPQSRNLVGNEWGGWDTWLGDRQHDGDSRSVAKGQEGEACTQLNTLSSSNIAMGGAGSVSDVERALGAAVTAVQNASAAEAAETIAAAVAAMRQAALTVFKPDVGEAEEAGREQRDTKDALAQACVQGCVSLYVSHLGRIANAGKLPRSGGAILYAGSGLTWLFPIMEMLGGKGFGGDALVQFGDRVRRVVQRLLCEKWQVLEPAHTAALSAVALTMANAAHSMAWLEWLVLRVLVTARRGVETCMAVVMTAMLHKRGSEIEGVADEECVYLWDARNDAQMQDCDGIKVPRLAFDLLLCLEPPSVGAGACDSLLEEQFWEIWESGALVPVRRLGANVPLSVLVMAVGAGLLRKSSVSQLHLRLATALHREGGGDKVLVKSYAEGLAALARAASKDEVGCSRLWGEETQGVKDLLVFLLAEPEAEVAEDIGCNWIQDMVASAGSRQEARERVLQACWILNLLPRTRLLKLLDFTTQAKDADRGRALGQWVQHCLVPHFTAHRLDGCADKLRQDRYPLAVGKIIDRLLRALSQQNNVADSGGMGSGLMESSPYAMDCLLLHQYASIQTLTPVLSWETDQVLTAVGPASVVAQSLTRTEAVPRELRSTLAGLVRAEPAKTLLARALVLKAFAAEGGRSNGVAWLSRSVACVARDAACADASFRDVVERERADFTARDPAQG